MPGGSAESGLQRLLKTLERHGVAYLLIGGQAEALMGSPRATYDTDVAYQRSPENLRALAAALRELNARLRLGEEESEMSFPMDEKSLALGNNFTFRTDVEDLNIHGSVPPVGVYEDLLEKHEAHEVFGFHVKTIGLEDLIRVKEHIASQKDSESLQQLYAIRRLREADG